MTRAAIRQQKLEYRLSFASYINLDYVNMFKARIATVLEQPNFGELTIIFSSEGGNTDQSLACYNFLRSLPVPIHMHASGHVGSASIPIFLASDSRTSATFSRFFLHEYAWQSEGKQTLCQITEAIKRLESDINLAKEIIRTQTKAPQDILGALDGTAASKILMPEEAKALGFVNEICDLGQTGRNGLPVMMWTG